MRRMRRRIVKINKYSGLTHLMNKFFSYNDRTQCLSGFILQIVRQVSHNKEAKSLAGRRPRMSENAVSCHGMYCSQTCWHSSCGAVIVMYKKQRWGYFIVGSELRHGVSDVIFML